MSNIGGSEREVIENILPTVSSWIDEGERFVIITVIGIKGSFPRPLGAQMAVSETGQVCGYISSGCLDKEIIKRALYVVETRKNECVRYGKNSKYIDIALPCGSGIELYFDQAVSNTIVSKANALLKQRQAVCISTDLVSGTSKLSMIPSDTIEGVLTLKDRDQFIRFYHPNPKLVVFGSGSALISFVNQALAAYFEVQIYSPDLDIVTSFEQRGLASKHLKKQQIDFTQDLDAWSAIILFFHEHDWELPILKNVLESECFYIGVQGSFNTHQNRINALRAEGFSEKEIERINGPMGLVPQAKSASELALSTLVEIVIFARKNNIQC